MNLQGVFVATITPFTAAGKLDLLGLEKHLEWLVNNKVNGFVPCATTGEGSTLTRDERKQVLRVCRAVAHKFHLSVIAGCGSNDTQTALELLRDASDCGSHAGLVVTPYYNKPTANGLLAHYQYLADRSPIPFLLYNVPSRTQVNLTPELSGRLMGHPKIIGIKEASANYSQWLELSQTFPLKEKALMAGDDDAIAPMLALGGLGTISASANVVPERFISLVELAIADRWRDAFVLQKKLFPIIRALFIETNPAPIKYALFLLRKMDPTLRLPLAPVLPDTQVRIQQALKELELL